MTAPGRIERLALAPALLVGAPRSGTTWLQRLLLHHPGCCGGQETHWFVHLDGIAREARRKLEMPRPHGVLCHLDEDALDAVLRRTWIEVATPAIEAAPDATILLEKTPDHARHLDLVDRLLPESRVIHLVRRPEDVVASLLAASRTDWGRAWAPGSVESAARTWVESVEAAEASGTRLGSRRFLRVRHGDLAVAPKETLSRIFSFLGLASDESTIAAAIDANTLETTLAGGGTPIQLRGAATPGSLSEPTGFTARPGSRSLSWRERRRCHRLTRDLARRLELDRDDHA